MASVQYLPDELLLKIFSYLDVSDVYLSVANVCSRWSVLAHDSVLLASLTYTVREETKCSSVVEMLAQVRQLRYVVLQWRTDTVELVKVLCKNCPSLLGIDFFCCGFVKEDSVKEISECYKNLRNFSLGKCYCVEYKCLDNVALLTNLTSLNLAHCPLTPEQFRAIAENCKKIISLNIDNIRGIPEEELVLFLTPRKERLISLTVFGELLTDNFFQHIVLCSKLKLLQISNCRKLTESCFERIPTLKHLNTLILKKFVGMASTPLHDFFFDTGANNNLVYLYVSSKRAGHIEGQVTKDDFSIWVRNKVGTAEPKPVKRLKTTIHLDCIVVLKRNGFNYLIMN